VVYDSVMSARRIEAISTPKTHHRGLKYRADDIAAENGLSFIETSALDASNVESAFQNILTGEASP